MDLRRLRDHGAFRIAAGDSVRLAVLGSPDDGWDATTALEIWDPGGSQPPNRHPHSVETFLFLSGSGVATSDGVERPVVAGDHLVLPAGSTHTIANTGPGRLYAITTMVPDDGFAALIRAGVPDVLDDDDLRAVGLG